MLLVLMQNIKWDKVFKRGPSKICERQPLNNLKDMVCASRPYPFKFFKGYPQILLGLLLNTLSKIFHFLMELSKILNFFHLKIFFY